MARAMAWKETCPMEERFRFIEEFGGEVEPSLSWACRRYGESRRTGYKWLQRCEEGGPKNLEDRPSTAILHCLGYFLERDNQPRLRPERPVVALAAGA